MESASTEQLRLFASLFESEILEWLGNLNQTNNRWRLQLRGVSIENRSVTALFDRNEDDLLQTYGYQIRQDELLDQAGDDVARAAYLCRLDIESEFVAILRTPLAREDDVVWLMND